MDYRLQCMMEHEYHHSLHDHPNRRLVDEEEGVVLDFTTQLQPGTIIMLC